MLKGVSLVLANNAKGINAVQNLQESFVEERTLDEALAENYNIIHPSPLHPMRDKIIAAFLDSSRSLKSINKEFELIDNSLKERVKEYASRYHIYDLLKISTINIKLYESSYPIYARSEELWFIPSGFSLKKLLNRWVILANSLILSQVNNWEIIR